MSRVDVLAALDNMYLGLAPIPNHLTVAEFNLRMDQRLFAYRTLRKRVELLMTAAHASLEARDLADQLAADDRLRAALAACEPTDTDHNREAVDGLCVEENDDEQ